MKKIIWLSICFFCLLSLPLQAEVVPLDTKPFEYELGEGQKSASDKDVKQMDYHGRYSEVLGIEEKDGVQGNNFLQRFDQLYDFKNNYLYLEVNNRLYTPFYDFLVH